MNKIAIGATASFFIFIVWIIYLADAGASSIFFDFVKSIPYGDKLGHFGLFGTLTLLLIYATRFAVFTTGSVSIYYAVGLVSLFVVVEEISQAFISTRTFDLVDLTADSIGIIAAAGFASFVKRYTSKNNTPQFMG